jgi:hypothetical protein
MHIDSLFCWVAHHAGFREEILEDPLRIYHIEHSIGSGWTPEGEQQLMERTRSSGVRWLDFEDAIECARFMNRYETSMIFSRENWGFADVELRETLPLVPCEDQLTPIKAHHA